MHMRCRSCRALSRAIHPTLGRAALPPLWTTCQPRCPRARPAPWWARASRRDPSPIGAPCSQDRGALAEARAGQGDG
eukprot:6103841-Prymnesium_polylepis.1